MKCMSHDSAWRRLALSTRTEVGRDQPFAERRAAEQPVAVWTGANDVQDVAGRDRQLFLVLGLKMLRHAVQAQAV